MFAEVPECACTLACSAPNSSLARAMAWCPTVGGVPAPAVIALARVAFRVLVGENRAHGLEHRFGDQVLRRNQLERGGLPLGLVAKQFRDLRIDGIERAIHAVVSIGSLRHGLVLKVEALHLTPGPHLERCPPQKVGATQANSTAGRSVGAGEWDPLPRFLHKC